MDFDIILCCDSEYGIGIDNNTTNIIPWKIAEDMKFFKDLTKVVEPIKDAVSTNDNNVVKTNAIIMGRKTADTLKNPLVDRLNVVITSQESYRPGFIVFSNLDDVLNTLSKRTDIGKAFVIGGSVLCDAAINHSRCRNVYLNMITRDYNCNVKLSDKFISKLKTSYVETSSDKEIVLCRTINSSLILEFKKYTFVNHEELAYLNMLDNIITNGDYRQTRNAKTYSVFGERLIFDLANGFPLLTTKKVFHRGIFEELLFFIRGDTNTKHLEDKKINIWSGNTSEEFMKNNNKNLEKGDMGPMYGFQWRFYNTRYEGCHKKYTGHGIDQLQNVIDLLATDPYSRRILMTTFNCSQVEEGVLWPCHGLIVQFFVENDHKISLQMYQRSVDCFLGCPYNIASYGLLLMIITILVNNHSGRIHTTDYNYGRIIMVFGDTHIYSDDKDDHVISVSEQLKRKNKTYPFPTIRFKKNLRTVKDVEELSTVDIEVVNYVFHPTLTAQMYA